MHFDELLRTLGEFGRYQKLQCFLVCLIIINTTMHAFNMVFTAATPKHRCKVQNTPWQWENLTATQKDKLTYIKTGEGLVDGCRRYVLNETDWDTGNYTAWVTNPVRSTMPCSGGWSYDTSIYLSSIVTEWDLVCDHDYMQSLTMSVFFAGRLFGSSVCGQLSDWFGRRPVFMLSIFLLAAAGLLASFCKILWMFCVCYFFQGFAQIGLFNCMFILGTEMVGPSYRLHTALCFHTFYAIGEVVLAGIAFSLRRWNYILLVVSVSGLPFLISYFLLPESVRWLMTKGRKDEVSKILKRVAKVNGKTVDSNIADSLEVTNGGKSATVIDLFKSWYLAKLALNVWFQGVVNLLVYYGISFNTPNLAGNPYVNFIILACSDIIAYAIILCIGNKLGHKIKYLSLLAVASVGTMALAFTPKDKLWLTILFAFMGKLGISGCTVLLNVMTLELFPTEVRNSTYGVAKTLALMGAMVAPYVIYLNHVFDPLPELVFGTLAILALIAGWFIPETAGKNLPQNISDMKSQMNGGQTELLVLQNGDSKEATYVPKTDNKDNKV